MTVIFEDTNRAGQTIAIDTNPALHVTEPGCEDPAVSVDLPGYDTPAAALGLVQAVLTASGLSDDYRITRTETGLGTEEELAAGLSRAQQTATA